MTIPKHLKKRIHKNGLIDGKYVISKLTRQWAWDMKLNKKDKDDSDFVVDV